MWRQCIGTPNVGKHLFSSLFEHVSCVSALMLHDYDSLYDEKLRGGCGGGVGCLSVCLLVCLFAGES